MTAQELKNSILQLAIQGKLVKQDPNDEPASVLLEKIKEERKKLIKEKKIKKEKYSEIYKDPSDNHYYEKFDDGTVNDITEEIPFDIPDSWRWVRLKDLCTYIFSGKNPKYSKSKNSNFVIGQKNNQDYGINLDGIKYCTDEFIQNYPEEMYLKSNDILLNTLGGGTVGRSGIFNLNTRNKYITDGHLFVFRTINKEISNYLLMFFKYNRKFIEKNANGSTNQMFLKLDNVKKYLISLPTENEIKRIITKYNNLLLLLEKYDNTYNRLEKLNNSYKEELKKSILQYSIQGKLVKQDPNDEPADVLINKILDEKRELIKSKQIKKENLSVIYKDSTDNQFYEKFDDGTINNITEEIPFEIPDNWAWTRIRNLSKIITKGSSPSWQGVKYIEKSRNSILFITSENVGKNKIVKDNMKYLEKKFNEIQPRSILERNDILTNIVGASIGRSCIYDLEYEDTNINQAVCLIRLTNKELNNYVLSYLNSPFCYKNLLINSVETARPNISLNTIGNLLVSLPPINEQKEIVLKLNNIIDKLETAE